MVKGQATSFGYKWQDIDLAQRRTRDIINQPARDPWQMEPVPGYKDFYLPWIGYRASIRDVFQPQSSQADVFYLADTIESLSQDSKCIRGNPIPRMFSFLRFQQDTSQLYLLFYNSSADKYDFGGDKIGIGHTHFFPKESPSLEVGSDKGR